MIECMTDTQIPSNTDWQITNKSVGTNVFVSHIHYMGFIPTQHMTINFTWWVSAELHKIFSFLWNGVKMSDIVCEYAWFSSKICECKISNVKQMLTNITYLKEKILKMMQIKRKFTLSIYNLLILFFSTLNSEYC